MFGANKVIIYLFTTIVTSTVLVGSVFTYKTYFEQFKHISFLNQEIETANNNIKNLSEIVTSLNLAIKEKSEYIDQQNETIAKLETNLSQKTNEALAKEDQIKQQQAEKDRIELEKLQAEQNSITKQFEVYKSIVQGCVLAHHSSSSTNSYYSCSANTDKISCSSSGYTDTCTYLSTIYVCGTNNGVVCRKG